MHASLATGGGRHETPPLGRSTSPVANQDRPLNWSLGLRIANTVAVIPRRDKATSSNANLFLD